MARSGEGGIGIGTIIFCVIMFNVIMDDDDSAEKAEISVEVQQPQAEVVIERQQPTVPDDLKQAADKIKEGLQDAVEIAKDEVQNIKETLEQDKKEETISEDVSETPEEKSEGLKLENESLDIPSTFKKL